ncbi:MAG: ACP S-malonyltransferase, partial [Candidatus Aureabacteria bacterium]|nr:ACP S-malonyltransferase [Candidatus Auribacterota bacterium]
MKKIAFIFPGQGSQYAGMGKDFYNSYSSAREVFDKADEILGFSLSEICFNGPEEKLTSTDICQPAILTCSIAAAKTIEAELRIKPVMCG